ncbi:MAG TPA: SDR family oxidoreductase [Nocardioidaceae bacterium]|nr:SDR family oxidoreductase [Nocardioidaceae bacterium]
MSNRPADLLAPDALEGQVALVTGGGTGIGRATALDLAKRGAAVVVTGRRPEPLAEVRDTIRAFGGRAVALPADLREDDEVMRVVDGALGAYGSVDILVNNAGGQFMAAAEDITPHGWRAVQRISVDAAWTITREVATRSMIPRRSGVVFFIAFSPRRGIAGMVHASAARAAVENLAAGLSLEWSRFGIRSICIAPGTIATDAVLEGYSAEDVERWTRGVPLGRLGEPEEVSGLICALASPIGSYVTGTTITVDGGVDAWGSGEPAPPTAPSPVAEES